MTRGITTVSPDAIAKRNVYTNGFGGLVTVYPREYREAQAGDGNPTNGDWADVLNQVTNFSFDAPVTLNQTADALADNLNSNGSSVVIVRPAPGQPDYTVTGVNLTSFD